jgi:ribosomal protein S18 acetylase RimI-like enzyme
MVFLRGEEMSANKVVFLPFADSDFAEFREKSGREYAQDLIRAGMATELNAFEESIKGFDSMLPQGIHTPNHYIRHILNEQGENVGFIWFENKGEFIFICDFFINEEQRRKGYGKQALTELDIIAKSLNVNTIRLHVFEFNTGAQELYKSMGYEITSTRPGSRFMRKIKRRNE